MKRNKDKEVSMTVEHSRSGYRIDLHPILAAYFAQEGLQNKDIALKLHISPRTLYVWSKAHPELAEALKNSREIANAHVVQSLYSKAVRGDVTAIIFYLLNRLPKQFHNKRDIEVAAAREGLNIIIDGSLVPGPATAEDLARDMKALVEEETPKPPTLDPRLPELHTLKKEQPEAPPTSCTGCSFNRGGNCLSDGGESDLITDSRERLCYLGGRT
jgi:hypothetical protein